MNTSVTPRQFKVTVNGREFDVTVQELNPVVSTTVQTSPFSAPQESAPVAPTLVKTLSPSVVIPPASVPSAPSPVNMQGGGDEVAQLGGVVVQVEVREGQTVAAGESLLILEAMKMKTHVHASRAGVVAKVHVVAGQAVEGGQALITIA